MFEQIDPDMSVRCGNGMINIRVGAIILKDGRFLMIRNDRDDHFYSVGGRMKFGETAEEALLREVYEETGVRMEIDHLGFIHENYSISYSPSDPGRVFYELSFYFYMVTPKEFEPVCRSLTGSGDPEYLEWVSADETRTIYPEFFRTQLDLSDRNVKHVVCDQRVYIRKAVPDDLDLLYQLLSDPDVMRYLEPPFSRSQTEHFLEKNGLTTDPRILIAEDPNHSFIGYVIYHDYDKDSKEIGWILKKDVWGKGYAGKLTKLLIRQAAVDGKDAVIECDPEQLVTKKIARRNGFEKTGTENGLEIYRRKCPA